MRAADAEVMESAGVAQGEFAAVIDGVVGCGSRGRGRCRVGWLWAGWCRSAQGVRGPQAPENFGGFFPRDSKFLIRVSCFLGG